MFSFKLNTLLATSFMAVTAIGSADADQPAPTSRTRTSMVAPQTRTRLNPVSEVQAALKVPTDRRESLALYYTLKRQADRGDTLAQDALKGLTSVDFSLNRPKVKEAVELYNQALQNRKATDNSASKPAAVPSPQHVEEETVTLPMPSRHPAPLSSPVADNEKPCGTKVSEYKALAEKCLVGFDLERKKLEAKIKDLEAKLGAAKQPDPQKKRDFVAEYEDLIRKLLTASENSLPQPIPRKKSG